MTTPSSALPPHIQAQIDKELQLNQESYGIPFDPSGAQEIASPQPTAQAEDDLFGGLYVDVPVEAPAPSAVPLHGIDLFESPSARQTPSPPTPPVATSAEMATILEEVRALRAAQATQVTAPASAPAFSAMAVPEFDATSIPGLPPEVQSTFKNAMTAMVAPLVEQYNALGKRVHEQDSGTQKALAAQASKVFEASVSQVHPDFAALRTDPAFRSHLSQPVSPYTPDITQHAAFTRAWNEGNLAQVNLIINDYKKTVQQPAPVTQTFRAPVTQVSTATARPAVAQGHNQRMVSQAAYDRLVDGYARKRVPQATMDAARAAYSIARSENRITT